MAKGWVWGVCAVAIAGGAAGAAAAQTMVADEERARRLQSGLREDRMLRDDEIRAEVGGGKVLLAGEVDSDREKERATEVVRRLDPTLAVQNFLTVEDEARERARPAYVDTNLDDKAERAAEKAGNAAREAGDVVSDGWVTSKVKSKLMADDGVDASAIDVDTQNRVVTLRGQVRSEVERARVVQHARHTKGVSVVVDEMKVAPVPAPTKAGPAATPPEGTQRR